MKLNLKKLSEFLKSKTTKCVRATSFNGTCACTRRNNSSACASQRHTLAQNPKKLTGLLVGLLIGAGMIISLPFDDLRGAETPARRCQALLSTERHVAPRSIFLLPAALKQAAAEQGMSVFELLTVQVDELMEFASVIVPGPFDPQLVIDFHINERRGDNVAYYYPARLTEGLIGVDPTLGTDQQYLQFIQEVQKRDGAVLADLIVDRTGYFPQTSAEQQHYRQLLREYDIELPSADKMRTAVSRILPRSQVSPMGQEELETAFLANHIFLPWYKGFRGRWPWGERGRWISRYDSKVFVQAGELPKEAEATYDSDLPSTDRRWQEAQRQMVTMDPFALPKLNLDNVEVYRHMKARIRALIEAGVAGFRFDGAKYVHPKKLRGLVQFAVESLKVEVAAGRLQTRPLVLGEYLVTHSQRLKDAQAYFAKSLGPDLEFVRLLDFQAGGAIRAAILDGEPYTNYQRLLKERREMGIDLHYFIPVVETHDTFLPFWDGSAESVAQAMSAYTMLFFTAYNQPILYNAATDARYGWGNNLPWAIEGFPRHQISSPIDSDNLFSRSLRSLLDVIDGFGDEFFQSTPIVDQADEWLILERRNATGKRVIAVIGRNPEYRPWRTQQFHEIYSWYGSTGQVRIFEEN